MERAGGELSMTPAEWAALLGVKAGTDEQPGNNALAFSRWLLPSIPPIVWGATGLHWRRKTVNGRGLVEITQADAYARADDDDTADPGETPAARQDRLDRHRRPGWK